jgi:transcriptional regulator of acetoin/glycerol metabolism
MEHALASTVNDEDEHPENPPDDTGGIIARSWRRCRAHGLVAGQARPYRACPAPTLAARLEASARLVAYAQPMLEELYRHMARSSSMVLLADGEGMILRSVGDASFMAHAARCHLQPGSVWSEAEMGTNAIGTALIERRTVAVVGRQHFLDRNRFLTGISAPILAPGGGVLGVFDLSGEAGLAQAHGAALIEMNVGIIENRLVETLPEAAVVLRLHASSEGLGSYLDGLLALADDGRCLAGNRCLPRLFGFGLAWSPAGAAFAELFATPWRALIEHAGRRGEETLAVRTQGGGELFVRVGLRAAAGRLAGGAPAFAVPPPPQSDKAIPAPPPADGRRCGATGEDGGLHELGGDDPRMAEAIRRARRIAECDIPLLIQGETGSGKEWFAQAFHRSGRRRDGPFVAVNCAAIPATLIEAELFGHVEGAFTGARRAGSRGRIREADGGTLFLDEIGDMPLALQAVLLRVLETRRIAPLGGEGEEAVDFALVCASHHPLRALVERGDFRADLFFRLSGMTVSLPPLRERQDFDRIVRRMLAEEAPGRGLRVAPAALDLLRRYDWPGNLRELRNVLRLAVALLADERLLTADFLPTEMLDADTRPGGGESGLRAVQARLVRETVARHGGNISAAARELGITRTTLYRKLAAGRGKRSVAPEGGSAI